MKTRNQRDGKWMYLVLAAAVLLVLWKCPFRYILGVPCPGCGMTRALYCALRLDFAGAWKYHPLIYLMPFVGIYLLVRKKLNFPQKNKVEQAAIWALALLFFIVYFWRMLVLKDSLVQIQPENGILFRFR